MSRRYYIAPVIGTGTLRDPYRAKIPAGFGVSAMIPSKADGTPRFAWALVLVAAADHSALLADTDLTALPAMNLDDAIPSGVKAAIRTKLQSLGLSASAALAAASGTLRGLVRAAGRIIDPSFDESTFSVVDRSGG